MPLPAISGAARGRGVSLGGSAGALATLCLVVLAGCERDAGAPPGATAGRAGSESDAATGANLSIAYRGRMLRLDRKRARLVAVDAERGGPQVSELLRQRGTARLILSLDPADGRGSVWLSRGGEHHRVHGDVATGDLLADGRILLLDPDHRLLLAASHDAPAHPLLDRVYAFAASPDGRSVAVWRRQANRERYRLELLPLPADAAKAGDTTAGLAAPLAVYRERAPSSARAPRWSPDGSRLLARGRRAADGKDGIWQLSPSAAGAVRAVVLPDGVAMLDEAPRWVSSGTLAVEQVGPDSDPQTVLFDRRGAVRRKLAGTLLAATGSHLVVASPADDALLLVDLARLQVEKHLSPPPLDTRMSVKYTTRYRNPLSHPTLTSWYSHSSSGGSSGGYRYDCHCNGSSCRSGHRGTDIAKGLGSPIYAAAAGKVAYRSTGCGYTTSCKSSSYSCGGGFGNHVRIRHADGMSTIYAHMSRVKASVGQSVSCGTLIGYVGSTGHSFGCHTHFEVWGTGGSSERVDPFAGKCNNAVSKNLWTSVSSGMPSAKCASTTPTYPRLSIKASIETIKGQKRDSCTRGKSKSIFDWKEGQRTEVHIDIKNSGKAVAKNVRIGLWAEEPYVRITRWHIYSDYKSSGFKLNDTDSMQKGVKRDDPGKSFTLWLGSMSPGETKRIKLSGAAKRFSIGKADHPDFRAWVKNIDGYYAKSNFWSKPSKNTKNYQTQNSGDLRAYAQTDVLSKERCDGSDNDCDGTVDEGCPGDGGPSTTDLGGSSSIVKADGGVGPIANANSSNDRLLIGKCDLGGSPAPLCWPLAILLALLFIQRRRRIRPRESTTARTPGTDRR